LAFSLDKNSKVSEPAPFCNYSILESTHDHKPPLIFSTLRALRALRVLRAFQALRFLKRNKKYNVRRIKEFLKFGKKIYIRTYG